METITRAIWGNGHKKQNDTAAEEPVAGVIGNTDSSDPTKPYDAGNDESAIVADRMDTQRNPDLEHEHSSSTDTSEAIQKEDTFIADSTTIRDGQNVNNDNNAPSNTTADTLPDANINNTPHASAPSSSDAITTTARDNTVGGGISRTTDNTAPAPPTSSDSVAQKQQSTDRPSEDPVNDATQTQAVKETKREEEEGISAAVSDEQQPVPPPPAPTPMERPTQSQESKPDTKGTKHESPDQGTSEKYVKSTGLAADGGDFDATRPGAGREAERLLEESGIHRGPGTVGNNKGDTQPGDPLMAKKGLGERVKEKIHPHGNHGKSEVNGGEKKGLGERVKEKIHLGKH